ncbi:helix-turn-helix domain-containing protein [Actinacidiphila glaucinigra]|uniref:helix-turn-helix domain-containing protein n=1 Tax=Actinacidiphila glaucinigra TaxID=235986 RepID=UPI0035E226BE
MEQGEGPLALVGVDAAAEKAYRHLLMRGEVTADEVAAVLGETAEEAMALMEQLHHAGLVGRRASREFTTVDPRIALRTLVESRERQLAGVRDMAGRLSVIYHAARQANTGEPRTRVISGLEDIRDCYDRLRQGARTEICILDRPPFLPAFSPSLDKAPARRGIRVRAVYAAASFDADGGWQELSSLVANGVEEARAVPSLPIKLAMADQSAALVSLSFLPGNVEYLYTEAPSLLEALTEIFDHHWTAASSLTGVPEDVAASPAQLPVVARSGRDGRDPGRGPTAEERRLLALLAAGVKREAIARQLGISSRTLQRRIHELFAELGATNRFTAGVAAARRNWL